MAGLGRRTFAPGEVLTATNVMGYLQDQAVMNFANAAARGSAIGTAVSEGMVSYLADSNMIETYTGTAWQRYGNGLTPVVPSSITANAGSASVDSLGVVTFSGCQTILLNGVFTSKYKYYRILLRAVRVGDSSSIYYMKFGSNGIVRNDSYAGGSRQFAIGSSTMVNLNGGDGIYLANNYYAGLNQFSMDLRVDNVNVPYIVGSGQGSISTDGTHTIFSGNNGYITADGVQFITTGGSQNGSVQVFGYNS